ncbi:hypothetical protein [Brevundimonas sp.]|uniref:hypothetical protein n=1 Tax=Brevundimonas sp. TaxID=1871086 RepID=UPI002730AF64|nr:hypothetical protein [Brevundimonas sp.]MDP1913160.1 hypothetical protein [Brevundimonas sp.]
MNRILAMLLGAAALVFAPAVAAQEIPYWQAVSADLFASTDADEAETVKAGVSFDWRYRGPGDYQGGRLEAARFSPATGPSTEEQRLYYRFAQTGEDWSWNGMVGTNGETVLGSLSVHNNDRIRQEYFIERERLETAQGLDQDLYHTFVGAAFDLPIDERNTLTALVGVQDFDGENLRTHLRARAIHVVKPEWGLSVQLRTRYFHNSVPAEADYFSPEWYVEVLPVVQVQRFHNGWRYQAAVGIGAQREAGSDWRAARHFEASVTSPPISRDWHVRAAVVHSNAPVTSERGYDYSQVSLSLTRAF